MSSATTRREKILRTSRRGDLCWASECRTDNERACRTDNAVELSWEKRKSWEKIVRKLRDFHESFPGSCENQQSIVPGIMRVITSWENGESWECSGDGKVGEIWCMRMSNPQSFMSGRQKFIVVIVKLSRIATCFTIIFLFRFPPKVQIKRRRFPPFPSTYSRAWILYC